MSESTWIWAYWLLLHPLRLAAIAGYACIDAPLSVIVKSPDSMSGNLDVMRQSAIRVMHKNRALLPPAEQVRFWQAA